MSFKTRAALFAALMACVLTAFCSCVNEDYDLTKDLDKSISIDGDISAPIGNSEKILVSDLLNLDENNDDVLTVDRNGDYSLFVEGCRIESSFVVPPSSFTEISVPGEIVRIGAFPDFLNMNGTTLDLYDPQILISVYNESPLPMTLNADIVSINEEHKASVHIGDKGSATETIRLEPTGTTKICISRTGKNIPAGYNSLKVENISDLFKIVPERMGLTNILIKADSKDIPANPDKFYTFRCAYDIAAPLAFGGDLRFEYSYDFTGWNETFNSEDGGKEFEVRNADVDFDLMNSIPLGFELTAAAIDKSATVIPGITVIVDGNVSAGSLEKPSGNSMTLNIKASAEDMRTLDGIRMILKAKGTDKEYQGICVNKNQGIKLENIKIKLQGSITTEL